MATTTAGPSTQPTPQPTAQTAAQTGATPDLEAAKKKKEDEEEKEKEKLRLSGVPLVAKLMTIDADRSTVVFRRFDQPAIRNLLYLEGRVAALDLVQRAMDEEDTRFFSEDEAITRATYCESLSLSSSGPSLVTRHWRCGRGLRMYKYGHSYCSAGATVTATATARPEAAPAPLFAFPITHFFSLRVLTPRPGLPFNRATACLHLHLHLEEESLSPSHPIRNAASQPKQATNPRSSPRPPRNRFQ